jgi:hypothetical protein
VGVVRGGGVVIVQRPPPFVVFAISPLTARQVLEEGHEMPVNGAAPNVLLTELVTRFHVVPPLEVARTLVANSELLPLAMQTVADGHEMSRLIEVPGGRDSVVQVLPLSDVPTTTLVEPTIAVA